MGCFPACFGHLRRNLTTKKVQDQCLSPSYEHQESVKLLPDITESQKEEEEEEIVVNPTILISESEAKMDKIRNEEKPHFDHSKVMNDTNELASSNSDKLVEKENGVVEKESEKGREDESTSRIQDCFLINDKECAAKEGSLECSPVQEESCGSLFSLSIDSRKHLFAAEKGEKEVSSTPLKMKNTSFKYDEEKENVPLKKDPMIEQSFEKSKPLNSVTSLSSWLVESEKSPQKLSPESEKNYGDRLVLGADEEAGVGTVGRYWRQRGGGQVEAGLLQTSIGIGSVEICM